MSKYSIPIKKLPYVAKIISEHKVYNIVSAKLNRADIKLDCGNDIFNVVCSNGEFMSLEEI